MDKSSLPSFNLRGAIHRDISDAIGGVPIVRLNRIDRLCGTHSLYVKLESCNPGGSIKEKNAAYLIHHAERAGILASGGTIIESSSGNFGIGLAMIGAARGYRVIIVVDAKTPPASRRILRAHGAELVDVPLSEADATGAMQVARMNRAKELCASIPHSWYPCQHVNPLNPHAHYVYTAREIEEAFGGAPEAIVVGISTAGQLAGLARYFRERYPRTRLVGVDVAGSVVLGTCAHPHKMTGLGLSFVPPNFDSNFLDCAFSVKDELAFSVCHALAQREGMLLGASTGAIVAAGLRYASFRPAGERILMINPDRGDRYLETIYDPNWIKAHGLECLSSEKLGMGIAALEPIFNRTERSKE